MTTEQTERAIIALERIGTALLRLATAVERSTAPPVRRPPVERAPAPDVRWVTTRRYRWWRRAGR